MFFLCNYIDHYSYNIFLFVSFCVFLSPILVFLSLIVYSVMLTFNFCDVMQVRSNIKNIYTFYSRKILFGQEFFFIHFFIQRGKKIFLPENFIPGHCNFCCDHCKLEWIEIKMNKITFSSGVKMFVKEKVKVGASAGCCVYNIGHNTSVCKGFTSLCLFQLIWCFDCCGIMLKKNYYYYTCTYNLLYCSPIQNL